MRRKRIGRKEMKNLKKDQDEKTQRRRRKMWDNVKEK
jgi:hypothetical protein